MTAARRIAVDLAGYSRRMGGDEAAARAVRGHRDPAHPVTLNAN
jgi:hypothetical protein